MHIHGNSMSIQATDFFAAAQAEKGAAARRAAEVRRKLLTSGQNLEGAASPEEEFLIGQWTDSRHSQLESAEQYHTSASGKDSDFG